VPGDGELGGGVVEEPHRPPFPFVVGARRSGASLVQAVFDSHPLMAVPPECDFVVALAPDGRRPFTLRRFLDTLYADERFRRWRLPRAEVELSFTADPPPTYTDAVRRVYSLWAERRGKRRYADKNPDHVLRIPALDALFPEARIIHVIRDGRDVAASCLELGWANTIEQAALHWRRHVQQGRVAGRLLPSIRYHELRYEDLVTDPEPTVRRLCQAVEVDFHPAMLDHRRSAAQVARPSPYPQYNRFVDRRLMPGLRDWRRDLPAEAVGRFELLAGSLLEELGYELQGTRLPRGVRWQARARQLGWHTRRLRSRRASTSSGPVGVGS
jgi:hypothetical protein